MPVFFLDSDQALICITYEGLIMIAGTFYETGLGLIKLLKHSLGAESWQPLPAFRRQEISSAPQARDGHDWR